MKRHTMTVLLTSAILAASFGRATAQEHGHGKHHEHGGKHEHAHGDHHGHHSTQDALKKAGATDEQLKQLTDLHHRLQLAQIELDAAVAKAELQLRIAMHDEKATETSVSAAVDAVFAARAKRAKSRVTALFRAKQILGKKAFAKVEPMILHHLHEAMIGGVHGHDHDDAHEHAHGHPHEHGHESKLHEHEDKHREHKSK